MGDLKTRIRLQPPHETGISTTLRLPASFTSESLVTSISALSPLVASAKQSASESSLSRTFQVAAPLVIFSPGETGLTLETTVAELGKQK